MDDQATDGSRRASATIAGQWSSGRLQAIRLRLGRRRGARRRHRDERRSGWDEYYELTGGVPYL